MGALPTAPTTPEAQPALGADILVVDDTPANLQLLSGMLKEAGYRVRVVPSGKLALASAEQREPDLILLDINMPHMDGYEVCRRLKADPRLAAVPVIFISALSEPLDKVKAFGSGGVDYVTKPFQVEEVGARVRTHLENRRLQRAIEARALELEQKHEQLRLSEVLRENLVHMIVHDMRTPLSGLLASLQFIEEDAGSTLAPENQEDLQHAMQGARRLAHMIDDILDIGRLEAGKFVIDRKRLPLAELFARARDTLAGLIKERQLTLTGPGDLEVYGDSEVLLRVTVNLLGNALKFTPESGCVVLGGESTSDGVRLTVTDEGPGIDPQHHAQIFDKFGQVQARRQAGVHSTGLGLTFCKLAVEAHGGRIGVDSAVGRGSRFWVELPGAPPPETRPG